MQDVSNNLALNNHSENTRSNKSDKDLLPALIFRLQQIGFELPVLYGDRSDIAGGVPLPLSLREFRRETVRGEMLTVILRLLRQGVPLTLSLNDPGARSVALANLRYCCDFLQAEIANLKLDPAAVGLSVSVRQIPLQAFQVLGSGLSGGGPRFVHLDAACARTGGRQSLAGEDQVWAYLWRNRQLQTPLQPVYGAAVRTACSLLSDEAATCVLPVSGVQVPAKSAWLPVNVHLTGFADDTGSIDWARLLPALAEAVEIAESIFELLHWPHSDQQTDAVSNRRLAFTLSGLGELIARSGRNPRAHESLKWLGEIVARIRQTLWHRSRLLAQSHAPLPALIDADPASSCKDERWREEWRRCWQAALNESAVRHRNMLVLSPYSVLPEGVADGVAYTDLLPVIALADAVSFGGAPDFADWSLREFTAFHRRASAVFRQQN